MITCILIKASKTNCSPLNWNDVFCVWSRKLDTRHFTELIFRTINDLLFSWIAVWEFSIQSRTTIIIYKVLIGFLTGERASMYRDSCTTVKSDTHLHTRIHYLRALGCTAVNIYKVDLLSTRKDNENVCTQALCAFFLTDFLSRKKKRHHKEIYN